MTENTTTPALRRYVVDGDVVEYHGSLAEWHGVYRVRRVYLTNDGARCDLRPVDGNGPQLGNVRLASVTVL